MSEPIPESIPTSHDPRSKRPTKRRALTPNGQQAAEVEALFAQPDREVRIPDPSSTAKARRTLAAPPEIVQNVQGSSAGAGSGEFHVYKASRRREYERLRLMDEETRREMEEAEFERQREEKRRKDEEKTNKNRARREKAKKRKVKAKEATPPGADAEKPKKEEKEDKKVTKGPRPIVSAAEDGHEDDDDAETNGGASRGAAANPEIGITIHDED